MCWIYPAAVHWVWGNGWLATELAQPYMDFSGCTLVHALGGVSGLVGAVWVGSRKNRWMAKNSDAFKPNSVPLIIAGCLILWFCFYGLNCAAKLEITGESEKAAAIICTNITISASLGGLTTFLAKPFLDRWLECQFSLENLDFDLLSLNNGILSGMVSICGSSNAVTQLGSFFIGIISGIVYIMGSHILIRKEIDDPLNAFPVHGLGGIWGSLAVGIFHTEKGILYGDDGTTLVV